MEDYILREINRIGELIAALMAKIGLMRQSASPEQIRTTAKTELAEKLDIDIDTLLDEPDFIGRLTDEYGFGDQELDKFAELLFDMVAASEQHAERRRLAAAVGSAAAERLVRGLHRGISILCHIYHTALYLYLHGFVKYLRK